MRTFFDSSAFAKRYIDEAGSDRVEGICHETSDLGLAVICLPEILSAFNRLRREGTLSISDYRTVKNRLMEDIRNAEIVNLSSEVINQSIAILESNSLRAMDSLHVACALLWEADAFVSADSRQIRAARSAGLKTFRI